MQLSKPVRTGAIPPKSGAGTWSVTTVLRLLAVATRNSKRLDARFMAVLDAH
jgi:hypothetical protein